MHKNNEIAQIPIKHPVEFNEWRPVLSSLKVKRVRTEWLQTLSPGAPLSPASPCKHVTSETKCVRRGNSYLMVVSYINKHIFIGAEVETRRQRAGLTRAPAGPRCPSEPFTQSRERTRSHRGSSVTHTKSAGKGGQRAYRCIYSGLSDAHRSIYKLQE